MKKSNLVKILKQELSILGDFIDGFNDVDNIHPMEVDLALSKVRDIKNELELLKVAEQNNKTENKENSDTPVESHEQNIRSYSEEKIAVSEIKEAEEEANIDEISDVEDDSKAAIVEPAIVEPESNVADDADLDGTVNVISNDIEAKAVPEIVIKEVEAAEEKELTEKAETIIDSNLNLTSEGAIEETVISREAIEEIIHEETPVSISEEQSVNEPEKTNKDSILADKFSQTKPSLNDMLAGVKQNKNLASLLKDSPIADLNKAIKLNDRIWYINELFGKNSATYEKAVKTVNKAENLDNALEYLFTNFSWNQERKSTISFLELVFRRFASN